MLEDLETLCPESSRIGRHDYTKCDCRNGFVLSPDGKRIIDLVKTWTAAPPAQTVTMEKPPNICFWCAGIVIIQSGRGFVHEATMKFDCGPEYPGKRVLSTAGQQTPGENTRAVYITGGGTDAEGR